MESWSVERKREELATGREVAGVLEAKDGQIVCRLDVAALTANNITYAVHGGPPLHYWNFFPASDPAFGIVPLWGFATIVESRCPDLAEGGRLYGYWPSASHALLVPGDVGVRGFAERSAHRQGLAPVYNSYRRVGAATSEDALAAVFQPLFGTGFVLARTLAGDAAAGRRILLTSASSKTALATAWNLRAAGQQAVGLTSATNLAFVRGTGLYAEVLSYEEVESLPGDAPAVLVDFAGNGALKQRLHRHLSGLVASHIVGDTDWQAPADQPLVGPAPALFFAPAAFQSRAAEIGAAAFEAELAAAMNAFLEDVPHWLHLAEVRGATGYEQAFGRLLANAVPPDEAIIWRP